MGVLGGGNGITKNGSHQYRNASGALVLTDDPTQESWPGDDQLVGTNLALAIGTSTTAKAWSSGYGTYPEGYIVTHSGHVYEAASDTSATPGADGTWVALT